MVKRKNTQERLFLKGEGDAYFQRNRNVLHVPKPWTNDTGLRLLGQLGMRPRRVLDIGCSNGWRCGAIQARYGSACVGIEPSLKAIHAGRRQFPRVRFRRGTLDHLPLKPGETFDLVIVHFVLHWVSRPALLKGISEIDRAVADGGYLMVGDFLPSRPTRVTYHHLPQEKAYTYKVDYDQILLATGLYRMVRRSVFDFNTHRAGSSISPHRRAVCTLMQKSTTAYYKTKTFTP
jgi:SAM-dependent methyltransferase